MKTQNELFEAMKALREQYESPTYVVTIGNDLVAIACLTYDNQPDLDVYTVNGVVSAYREILKLGDDPTWSDLQDIWNKALCRSDDE